MEGCKIPVCGVLFCGGCNPRFDRMELFSALKARFGGAQADPAAELIFYQEGQAYDCVLLINGCTAECLMEQSFSVPRIVINSGDPDRAAEAVRAGLSAAGYGEDSQSNQSIQS